MDLPEDTTTQNPEEYPEKIRDAQSILVQATQLYLKKNQRKIGVDYGPKDVEVTKYSVGDYVLLTYPNRPHRDVSWPNHHYDNGSSGSGESQKSNH